VSDIHNHELDKKLDGHLIVGHLKPREEEAPTEMTRNLVPYRNIMAIITHDIHVSKKKTHDIQIM
jgi:hypothetical protein